jgi:PEP-CTERM motif
MSRVLAGALISAAILAASAPSASAASLLIDDFANPGAPNTYSAAGVATIADTTEAGPPVRSVFADSYINPLDGVTTLTTGGGEVTLSSPMGARAEVLLGYGAFAGVSESIDTTPYNDIRLDFARATDALNLNVVFYSSTGPSIFYLLSGRNVSPAPGNAPFTTYIPISSLAGFDRTNVDGIVLVVDRSGDSFGASWALKDFALTTGVPEPGSWALMIGGLGLAGVALRTRRRILGNP